MRKRDLLLILLLVSFFVFIVVLLETGYITNIETFAYNEIIEHMNPIFTVVVKGITNIGGPAIIICICIVLLSLSRTRKRYGLPVVITVFTTVILNFILKNIFGRERPDVLRLVTETSYSFPSGHSMINAALYTILVLLILKYSDSKKRSIIISIALIILFLLIGVSRIYLGVHYLGDVVAGWVLGILVAFVVYLIFKKIEEKSIDK